MAIIPAFQAEDGGSIPPTRTKGVSSTVERPSYTRLIDVRPIYPLPFPSSLVVERLTLDQESEVRVLGWEPKIWYN